MSYDVKLFHKDAPGIEVDEDDDDLDYPAMDKQAIADFIDGLKSYGYELESESPQQTFVKDVDGCPIQVTIFETVIAFKIPYWKNSEAAIFDALMDAEELIDPNFMALYNQQSGEWS